MIFNKITGIEFRPYLRFCLLPWDYLQVKSEIHVFFKNFHAYNDDFFSLTAIKETSKLGAMSTLDICPVKLFQSGIQLIVVKKRAKMVELRSK